MQSKPILLIPSLVFGSILISYVVTSLSIRLSLRRGRLDVPNERSSHSAPVPRLGGLGVLAGYLIPLTALWIEESHGRSGVNLLAQSVWMFACTAVVLGGAGLYDDLYGLRPVQKFGIQFPFALSIAYYMRRFAGADAFSMTAIGFLLALLWLVSFTNFYNFMDGVNGLAGATAVLYGVFLAYFAWQQGQTVACIVAALVAGASLGFLFYNFPYARTFMGDTGSLFLGMLFAVLALFLHDVPGGSRMFVPLILLYSVFIYDCTITLLRRVWRRENVFRAHRSHIYQRLVKHGWSHPRVTFLYMGLHILGGSLAIVYLHVFGATRWIVVGTEIVALVALTVVVSQAESRRNSYRSAAGNMA
jgi:UDP-N-acetylmuramyl pentapeptide phosphotransferase/UDP-N-acetylglucosamine-1-phosphate transferase